MKNFFLISVPVFLLSFSTAEFYARHKYPDLRLLELTGKEETLNKMAYWTNRDPFCAYEPKPGNYAGNKTVNRNGFISTPDISIEKQQGITRVVYLGGSSTAGTGANLPDSETYPWKVDSLLKTYGYNVDFINAAAGGYTTFESYGRLWSRLRFYNPDVIIVNHGWNDAYYLNPISGNIHEWRETGNGDYELYFNVYYESFKPFFLDRFIAWSTLLSAIRLGLHKEKGQGEIITEKEKNDVKLNSYDHSRTQVFSQNLYLIKQFAERFGCSLFVCKQPTLPTLNQPLLDSHFTGHGYDHKTFVKIIQNGYYIIDTLFNDNSIIDLTSISGNKAYFYDNIHPTEAGTDKIAEIMADSLKKHYFVDQ